MSGGRGQVFPAWAGRFLAGPLRRLSLVPEAILRPLVVPGGRAADIGCGMGFFSLPLAELLGPEGRVFCIDLQQGMLEGLARRAAKEGLSGRIVPRRCRAESLEAADLAGSIDFALAFNVAHELPDPVRILDELAALLRSGGRALLCEPSRRVPERRFEELLAAAGARELVLEERPEIASSRAALLRRA